MTDSFATRVKSSMVLALSRAAVLAFTTVVTVSVGSVGAVGKVGAQSKPSPGAAANRASGLPSPATLMAQFNTAIGGRAAVKKIISMHVVGTMTKGDMVGTFEQVSMRPDKSITTAVVSGVPTFQGYDGKIAWAANQVNGPRILTGQQAEDAKLTADYDRMLRDPSNYISSETVGKANYDGHDCYKVRVVSKTKVESFDCFDVKTHFLVAKIIGPTTMFYRKYKSIGGVMFPTEEVTRVGNVDQVLGFTKIQLNQVTPKEVEIPAPIKAHLPTSH